MKSILLLLLVCCFKFSCTSEQPETNFTCLEENEEEVINNSCIDNWECNFTISLDSKVDIDEYFGKSTGNKMVFQMINETEGDLTIADDEYTIILVFEIDDTQGNFSVRDAELEDLKVYYRRVCYCVETDFFPVTLGCLQGIEQPEGTWLVQGNLNSPLSHGTKRIKFDASFKI